jgi:MFS family permease
MYVKRLQFYRVIPVLVFCWGLVCMCTGFIQNYAGLIVCRLLLGAFEGCLFPSMTMFLLNWYRREEVGQRVCYLYGMVALLLSSSDADTSQSARLCLELLAD